MGEVQEVTASIEQSPNKLIRDLTEGLSIQNNFLGGELLERASLSAEDQRELVVFKEDLSSVVSGLFHYYGVHPDMGLIHIYGRLEAGKLGQIAIQTLDTFLTGAGMGIDKITNLREFYRWERAYLMSRTVAIRRATAFPRYSRDKMERIALLEKQTRPEHFIQMAEKLALG